MLRFFVFEESGGKIYWIKTPFQQGERFLCWGRKLEKNITIIARMEGYSYSYSRWLALKRRVISLISGVEVYNVGYRARCLFE